MSNLAQWLTEIPEQVKTHLATAGLTTAELVADSVGPEIIRGSDGSVTTKTVDMVFIETIAKACDQVQQGTAAWAQVRKLYARCHAETVAQANAAAAHPEVEEVTATDPSAEAYYDMSPQYRKKRLEALVAARRCEVDDSRLPSGRLWGRYERLKRNNKEFVPLPPTKIQSEFAASRKPAQAQLQPGAGGVLTWRMPAIEEPAANSMLAFEEAMFIVENLLYLTGWVSQLQPLETFHARFWARARKSWTPAPGYRPLNLSELQHAFELFQRQWARASRAKEGGHIDDAVTASLPADTDELDGRLALAPRLQTAQQDLALEPRGHRGNGGGTRQPHDERAEQPKGKGKGKADRGTKRKAPAAGAAPNKATKRDQPCKFMAKAGTCRFGDRCWYAH